MDDRLNPTPNHEHHPHHPMKRKPILGETLFSLNVGNAARRGIEQKLTPVTVTKVGRKYFEVLIPPYRLAITFHIESWRQKTDYSATHSLYESEQERLDEKERHRLHDLIHREFSGSPNFCTPTLTTLRAIAALIQAQE